MTQTAMNKSSFNKLFDAVNSLEVTNSVSGNGAKLGTQGDDANIDLILGPKGSGVVDVNSSRISNLTDTTQDQDTTKSYVDNVVNGLDVKESVRLATTVQSWQHIIMVQAH